MFVGPGSQGLDLTPFYNMEESKETNQMGQTGFCEILRFPAVFCGFLRFAAKICAFHML